MLRRQTLLLAVSCACLGLGGGIALALEPSNVLVLYNSASPEGSQIASYYAAAHPGATTLAISNVPTTEQVTYDVYLNSIRPQVMRALTSSTDVIVTTKGLPLRIDNPMPTGWSGSWNRYSSLESELARVDSIGSRELMGNQSYSTSNPLAYNPYYYQNAAFSYAAYGTRLTSRLDAYTVADVEGMIDRAGRAVYDRPGYRWVMDDSPDKVDRMEKLRDTVLAPQGLAYTYDYTTGTVCEATGAVIGYVGHGVNGGATPGYIDNLQFNIAPGAVFETYESYNAYTFTVGVSVPYDQGQIAQWIRQGGTAGVGNVWEPFLSTSNITREDRLFQMLLSGYTFAEAAWNATCQTSFVSTFVGDPLMRLRSWIPGDADMDGMVYESDLDMMLYQDYGSSGSWSCADLNGDGVVDDSDFDILCANYGRGLSCYSSPPIPEPGALLLLLSAGVFGLVRRRSAA